MDEVEPRVRRRGFFLHSPDGEPDTGEHENPEGFAVRVRVRRRTVTRQVASSSGRSHSEAQIETTRPEIRSGSVTGSRQRAHLPR
jgi:hypothetical protein